MRRQSGPHIWIAAGMVSALLLTVVLSRADITNICHMAANVSAAGLLGALATLVVVNLVCSIRLARSVGPVNAHRMLAATDISVIHSVLLALLPARLGDLYYPVLLKRLSIGVGRAIASLSLLRLFDAAVLGTMFVLAALSTAAFPDVGLPKALIAVGMLLLGALVALALMPKLCAWLAMLALRWRSPRMREVARQALDGRRWLNSLPFNRRLELFGLTILYWEGSTLVVWLVIESLGVNLMATLAAFVASGLSLAGAMPLQTIAGFGVAEASFTLLLVIVGFPSIEAASIGVVARFGLLALPIAVAALWLLPRWTFLHWKAGNQ